MNNQISRFIPKAPPIKSQGIKTKLVPFILESIHWAGDGVWIEPFMGSGVVAFNARPKVAILADTNRHIVEFYRAIQDKHVTPGIARSFLSHEGALLLKSGQDHYYLIRERFNKLGDPLDFLFLSRACFNGVMRFNSKGKYNVPFCRKPDRFRPAYITKIANQVAWVADVLSQGEWKFEIADWRETLMKATSADFVYVDPPYFGRHTDYYSSWNEKDADDLAKAIRALPSAFAYSMWSKNQYRENDHLRKWFYDFPIVTKSHFYHVGSTESLRGEIEEALVLNINHAVNMNYQIQLSQKQPLLI